MQSLNGVVIEVKKGLRKMTQNAVTTTKVDTTLSVFSGQENFQNAMIMAEQKAI